MRIRNWSFFYFVVGYHVLILGLLPFAAPDFSWAALGLMLATYVMGGLAITVGYHRLFAHKTYSAEPWWEWACLLSSTLAFEASALLWSHDHRIHHKHVDTDKDPYNINRGFWYAHVLWIFDYQREMGEDDVTDLKKNPRVMFQHRHYLLLTVLCNLAIFGLGCLFLSPLASFFYGVLLRIFMIHHCTWFINSLAHTWGSKTYAKEQTAVDNAVMAVLTFGEGYHNYHHTFANDYRNGIRWYHFDPSKWTIWLGSRIGATHKLRTVHRVRLQKILISKDKKLFLSRLSEDLGESAVELRQKLEELATSFEKKASLLVSRLNDLKRSERSERKMIKMEVRRLRRELRAQWRSWVEMTHYASDQFGVAHA